MHKLEKKLDKIKKMAQNIVKDYTDKSNRGDKKSSDLLLLFYDKKIITSDPDNKLGENWEEILEIERQELIKEFLLLAESTQDGNNPYDSKKLEVLMKGLKIKLGMIS